MGIHTLNMRLYRTLSLGSFRRFFFSSPTGPRDVFFVEQPSASSFCTLQTTLHRRILGFPTYPRFFRYPGLSSIPPAPPARSPDRAATSKASAARFGDSRSIIYHITNVKTSYHVIYMNGWQLGVATSIQQ
jgi:hypothetical protein